MPMPAPNSPWPPKPWDQAYKQYAENDAWLTGNTRKLADLYGNAEATHSRAGRPHSGGVVGAMSRLFWGRPTPTGSSRTRLHIPLPADLATLASDLQYSDPPVTSINAEKVDDKTSQRLDELMNSDDMHAMLNSMGEIKSALGAVIVLPRWDEELDDHVWLDYAPADTAIPVFRHGRLVEVTLWSEHNDGTHVYYRHLEHHATGSIEHALFRGTATNLGLRVPLEDHPATAPYAELVDADSRIATNIDRLTAGYLPNAPALSWRRQAELRHAGRSDFNQCIPLFDAADEAFSSWMRDLKLGSAKLIVPEQYLKSNGPGLGASFDLFQEMFVGLEIPGAANEMQIDAHQFAIRVEEHERTLRGILREILRKAGYSPSSWGDPDQKGGQATATEIEQRTEQTERTRKRKNLYDRKVLSRMGSVALELDGLIFPGKGGGRYDLNVVFPELSRTDPKTEAETIGLLSVAGAISTETAVRRVNPDWTDDEITEEVDRIRGVDPVEDPFTFDRVDEE